MVNASFLYSFMPPADENNELRNPIYDIPYC